MARQRGSHMILVKEGSSATLSVPGHTEVAPGAGEPCEASSEGNRTGSVVSP